MIDQTEIEKRPALFYGFFVFLVCLLLCCAKNCTGGMQKNAKTAKVQGGKGKDFKSVLVVKAIASQAFTWKAQKCTLDDTQRMGFSTLRTHVGDDKAVFRCFLEILRQFLLYIVCSATKPCHDKGESLSFVPRGQLTEGNKALVNIALYAMMPNNARRKRQAV